MIRHPGATVNNSGQVIARIFDAEAAMLVRGAGTDAIADALYSVIKACRDIPIVTDDNYAVMKVAKNGSQCGADDTGE